jgi:hypothetical protein
MSTKNKFRVLYSLKSDTGFLVEKSKQFTTLSDAKNFIQVLQSCGKLVGRAICEVR